MEACQQLHVLCHLIHDNHQAEKERFWRNKKKSKNTAKRTLTLYVC